MAIQGCDYSSARPSPASLYAAGKRFVCRYLSYRGATAAAAEKFLTATEAAALHAAGLAIVANFESTGDRASTAGAAGGAADGNDARMAMNALGFPVGSVCYVTVQDTGLSPTVYTAIATYLTSFRSGLGANYRVGIYCGSMLRAWLALHGFRGIPFWQSAALSWSGGVWDPTAAIQQRGAGNIPGTDADTALLADYGQWAPPPPAVDTEVVMPIYSLPGTLNTGSVAAGTPYYTNAGDPSPRSHTTVTQRYLLHPYDATGKWVAIDGTFSGPVKTTPQMLGWVKLTDVTDIQPAIPAPVVLSPFHVEVDVNAASAPTVNVTKG